MPSKGSVGAYDYYVMAESFFVTFERGLLSRHRFKSQAEIKMALFEWTERCNVGASIETKTDKLCWRTGPRRKYSHWLAARSCSP
jgi:hypothetical protein